MHRRWLSLTLLSTTVSAFYPYCPPEDDGSKEKRFFPIREDEQKNAVTLDIKKVATEKRDNAFPVVLSSKPDMPNAMAIDEDGSDFSYISVMKFGAKRKPMYMLIDTGSANTWVFDSKCPSSSCTTHNTFGTSDSNTLNVTKDPWSLMYGTGEVTGVVASDTVAFANYSIELGFGLATTASDDFNYYPMDGILGLGRASSNELGVPTIMEALDHENLLQENIIGVHLQRSSDGSKDGQITFGDVDRSKFKSLSYTNSMSDDSMWEIPADDAGVDGQSGKFTGKSAIIDTGTSYILMPLADALKLHQLIPGASHTGENFVIPCDATSIVQFAFSGITYSVGPDDYLGKASGNMCSSNIIGHQAFGPNQWILGDVFLKNVYTVFDFDKDRIGFGTMSSSTIAALASSTTAQSSSTQPASTPHSSPSPSAHPSLMKTTVVTSTTTTRPSSSSTSATTAATTTLNSSPFGDTSGTSGASRQQVSAGPLILIALFFGLLV